MDPNAVYGGIPDHREDLVPEKYYQPDKWSSRHMLVCDLHVIGRTNNEIAEELGYDPSRVSVILSDQRAHQYIRSLREKISDDVPDVLTRLKLLANSALDEIVSEMRESTDPRIRQKAAFGILDRAGYTPVQKVLKATVPKLPEGLGNDLRTILAESNESRERFKFEVPKKDPNEIVQDG